MAIAMREVSFLLLSVLLIPWRCLQTAGVKREVGALVLRDEMAILRRPRCCSCLGMEMGRRCFCLSELRGSALLGDDRYQLNMQSAA